MRGDGLHRPGTKPGHAPTHALCLCQTMMSFIRALPANALRRRKSPPFTMSSPDLRRPAETARAAKAWKPCSFDHVAQSAKAWWSQTGSNRRPHACKARALPTELWPLVVPDPVRPRCRTSAETRRPQGRCGGPRQTRTADLTLIRRVL